MARGADGRGLRDQTGEASRFQADGMGAEPRQGLLEGPHVPAVPGDQDPHPFHEPGPHRPAPIPKDRRSRSSSRTPALNTRPVEALMKVTRAGLKSSGSMA